MTGNQLAIIGDHAGYRPAKLRHAGGDLCYLIRVVHFGVIDVSTQPFYRPFFDLSGRTYQAITCHFSYWLGWILQDSSGILFGYGGFVVESTIATA